MGRLRAKSDYENLRNARISENQARLASLGLEKTASDLHSIISSTKPIKTPIRKYQKSIYDRTCLRRSDRLKGKPADPKLTLTDKIGLSERTRPMPRRLFNRGDDEEETRPANAPFLSIHPSELQLPPDVLARRCDSKSRGSVYNSILGICCHFCRQKKLCGEEDCKRCGNGDIDQPCIGKTDCSVCHSSNGILCRACLKVRYGEEMEKVRNNKKWMCPHCIEDQGLKPFWICNSSICLKKRKIAPTGIAIFEAREKGFKSVAHLLMDKLKQAEGRRSQS
ncbi:uncharacterized protein LOC131227882 isoform X2 [Magnolia sinica]|uniref:uncharacterized protein LOC131227882 isoform X2 n=1 Tax=Magnolia sinica TaxID=86752 RepID=UPI00265B6DFF|nr:uncharacterized protein LOC131227882 isoform X2 [Magnolia sinica]